MLEAFEAYRDAFRRVTARAASRFDAGAWAEAQRDSQTRLELPPRAVGEALRRLAPRGPVLAERALWAGARRAFAHRLGERGDLELALTFFNSVARRALGVVGVDPEVEFGPELPPAAPVAPDPGLTRRLPRTRDLVALLRDALAGVGSTLPWEDLERDARVAAEELGRRVPGLQAASLELLNSPFYRNKAAYLIGRLHHDAGEVPIVLAVLNPAGRLVLDALLTHEDEASVVFSFTRSYFMVEAERPRELVGFLRSLMPRKPVSDLWSAIGHNKRGKTELYRALLAHLASSEERFEIAPGARGMVMVVFTLPSHDMVFKVIRDAFDPPKSASRRDVMRKYELVFRHDRAGRLIDAQEFESLSFGRQRFSEPLLAELQAKAASGLAFEPGGVVLRHAYVERRVRPLDLYVREASRDDAVAAVIDYGQAVRDLAATNIFPGDLLLKNFGVTRHGRVVFYDYDELGLLEDLRFRRLPEPTGAEEEAADAPWFYVGERDIFPEELGRFLGLRGELRESFMAAHGALFDVEFWLAMQQAHRDGHIPDIFPYPAERRLGRREASARA